MKKATGIAALALLTFTGTAWAGSANRFGAMISPVSNPTNFEDPRIESDVRPIFAYHQISDDFLDVVQKAGLRPPKGDAQVIALQLRIKLMERLALIATKDGYVWVDPENDIDNIVTNGSGFADLAFGLKYNFYLDEILGLIGTGGIRYEAPSGEPQALQGSVFRSNNALNLDLHDRGSGMMNLFLSGAWAWRDLSVLGYTGPRLALSNVDSSFYDTSLHADYRIGPVYPLLEINWIHVLEGGNRLQPLEDAGLKMDQEGFDFFNLGAPSAGGTDVATIAFGGRWRITDKLDVMGRPGGIDFGTVAEFPMTSRHDIFGWRVTTDFVFWMN